MSKSRSAKSVRNIAFGYMQQLITLVLAFVTRTIFVRLLGAEYSGVNGLFTNILTLLSLAELGVGNVLTYSLYGAIHENNETKINQYISFYRRLYYVIAVAIAVAGVILIPFLDVLVKSSLPKNEVIIYYILYLTNSVVSYFVVFKVTLLRADQKEYIKNIVSTITLVLQYVFQIVFLLIWKNYVVFLLIQIAFTIVQNLTCNIIANKQYPYLRKHTRNSELIDKPALISNVKSMFIYKVSNVVVTSTDNILISVLLGTIYVGYYSNYSMIINYVSTFINLTITGITGSLGNLNAANSKEHSYSIFRKFVYLFGVITIFCASCLAVTVQGFIPIWVGEQYVLRTEVLAAVILTFYITHVFDPTWMFCETMGLFRERKYAMILNAILNIILSFIFSKKWGMAGILFATAISRCLTIVWWEPYILFKYKFKRPLLEYVFQQIKITCTNVLIFITSILLCSLLPNSFFYLVIRVIICGVVMMTFEIVCMGRTEEFRWMAKKIKNIVWRQGV